MAGGGSICPRLFLEAQQVVVIRVDCGEGSGARCEHFVARDGLVAIAAKPSRRRSAGIDAFGSAPGRASLGRGAPATRRLRPLRAAVSQ
jgi:hypothetical protein